MIFRFTAKIYRNGINLCVDVPVRITSKFNATKGYIYIKGTINNHPFTQTLVPVKDAPYRLFVNGPMIKGSGAGPGEAVRLIIDQNINPEKEPFTPALKKAIIKQGLTDRFGALSPSRKKEIFRYLNKLKTKASLERNIEKVIAQLKGVSTAPVGFLRRIK